VAEPAPLVVDTDIGGEPDDAMALAIAARHHPELALVLTCDEVGGEFAGGPVGERARFARYFLDCLGRPDVPVAAGRRVGGSPYFWIRGLAPHRIPVQPANPVQAVIDLC
jgi:inosine-uridine nucleoside N-ribohydrolase